MPVAHDLIEVGEGTAGWWAYSVTGGSSYLHQVNGLTVGAELHTVANTDLGLGPVQWIPSDVYVGENALLFTNGVWSIDSAVRYVIPTSVPSNYFRSPPWYTAAGFVYFLERPDPVALTGNHTAYLRRMRPNGTTDGVTPGVTTVASGLVSCSGGSFLPHWFLAPTGAWVLDLSTGKYLRLTTSGGSTAGIAVSIPGGLTGDLWSGITPAGGGVGLFNASNAGKLGNFAADVGTVVVANYPTDPVLPPPVRAAYAASRDGLTVTGFQWLNDEDIVWGAALGPNFEGRGDLVGAPAGFRGVIPV